MKSLLKAGCACVLALAAPVALGLGVGNLRVSSLQGAPLAAEVDLLASLDQMEAAWTVEILEDRSGETTLEPEVQASLGGTVQRAPDGSLFVQIRSDEPVPGPDISFRLRLVSQQEAVVARMSGTLLALPKPPPMAQRPSLERPAGRGVGPGIARPTGPATEIAPTPQALETAAAPNASPYATAEPPGTAAISSEAADAPPQQMPALAEAAPAEVAGQAESASTPVSAQVEALQAVAPADQTGVIPAASGLQDPSASAPATGAEAAASTPTLPASVSEPVVAEPAEAGRPWTELVGFSVTQGLIVAACLAALVVLLVLRRRLASLVMGRFTALRDEALKAQMATKLEAQAAQKAKAANARIDAETPAPRAEADLNAEIDVLLAYAEYGKAEEKLQAALREAPNNIQARLRLAELRYITEDSAGFVELVEQIQARHRSELTDEQWQKLTRMGKVVAPDAALFAGPRVVHRDAS